LRQKAIVIFLGSDFEIQNAFPVSGIRKLCLKINLSKINKTWIASDRHVDCFSQGHQATSYFREGIRMLQEISPLGSKPRFYREEMGGHVFEDLRPGLRGKTEYEYKLLKELNEMQGKLLKKIEQWAECPLFYRRKLLSRLRSIDLSKKEAFLKIDEIKRELQMLAFNLSLNPTWIRGLLKLIDKILDQTEARDRKSFSTECGVLESQLNVLKKACHLYQIERDI